MSNGTSFVWWEAGNWSDTSGDDTVGVLTAPHWGDWLDLKGDVNNDSSVNIQDLSLVGAGFGSSPPANYAADLNLDGRVDIRTWSL